MHQQDIEGKSGAVDLLAQLDIGKKIHFEVQVVHQAFYPERSLYYASRLYGKQLKKGQYYKELQPVICIHILLFNLFEENHAVSSFQVLNVKNHKPLKQHFNMVFIELNNIEQNNNLNDHLKQSMEFMKEPSEHRQELEKKQSFQETYEELEKLSKDPSQKWAYFCAFKRLKDEESREVSGAQRLEERAIAKGKLEGRAAGRAEGEAAGKAKTQNEIIKNLASIGMSAQQISEIVNTDVSFVIQTLSDKK